MSNQGKFSSITIILLIIGLVIGAGGGYLASSNSLQPEIIDLKNQVSSLNSEISTLIAAQDSLEEEKSDLETQVVELNTQLSSLEELLEQALLQLDETTDQIKIGMLAREEKSLSMMQSIAWIAEDEINRYCEENGITYRFEFLLESTQGQAAIALEKVQSFKAMGIDLVVAYLGSEYYSVLSYINENSMVFIDAVNTMPEFTFPDDRLYRMHPTWAMQGYALAENMWSLGKEAVIIVRQDSPYLDEIYDVFTTRYVAKGGDIFAETVLPGPEVLEYSTFLSWLVETIDNAHTEYGECKVGIQLVAYTDFLSLFPYLTDYPTALNVIWFGNEATANQPTLFMYHPITADKIKILSPSPFIDVDSDMYQTFTSAYSSAYGGVPSYEACLVYDSCWVMAKSMIAAESPDGDQVNPLVITTSNNHQGVTGWCKLDANGDRALMEYDIWGYCIESDGFTTLKYGYYTGETDTTTWLTTLTDALCSESVLNSLFVADFEDDTVGSPPAPSTPLHYGPPGASLDITGDTNAFEVVDSAALGSKALKITRGYDPTEVTAVVGDIGEMPYTSGVVYIDYWAHGEAISEPFIAGMSISVRSEDGPAALIMRLYDGSYHLREDDTYVRMEGSYDPSTPHFVHIVINMDTRKYSIYIDSEALVIGKDFLSVDFTDLHMLNFWVTPTITEAFPTVYIVDDIRITK